MKRAVFIGRWTPFHKGHLEIMKSKIEKGIPLLILVRNTHYDVYPAPLRKRMIEAAMAKLKVDAKVIIIDDIESVNWGRGVGYEVNEIEVPDDVKNISATKIRELIDKGENTWCEYIPDGADKILEDYISRKGKVIWFTGRPKAGKKTISDKVKNKLKSLGIKTEVLNSTIMRNTISKDLGFSKEDRDKNIERAVFVSELLSRNGAIVLSSFITPYQSEREMIRTKLAKNASYIEVFVKASVETCKKRDDSGIYEKAEKGEISYFTGISDPYEEPENPTLSLDTENKTAEQCAEEVVTYLLSLM